MYRIDQISLYTLSPVRVAPLHPAIPRQDDRALVWRRPHGVRRFPCAFRQRSRPPLLYGLRPVLVHVWLPNLFQEPQLHNRHRVTDSLTMEVVEMVLISEVNKPLVWLINSSSATAIGLCGKLILTANSSSDSYVGEVSRINTSILHPILASGHIPVKVDLSAPRAAAISRQRYRY